MTPLLLPMTSWDTLTALAFNRKVLMVGVADGQDVMTLAQTAAITAVYASVDSADLGRQLSVIDRIDGLAIERGLSGKILLHDVTALLGITQYHPGAFDLVVFNPAAAGSEDAAADLEQLAGYGRDLVVIDGPDLPLWDQVTSVTAPRGLQAVGYGQIIVARPLPAAPTVRRD
jgi:hypothetical protein